MIRTAAIAVLALLLAAPLSAQTIRTRIVKPQIFGLDTAGATLWPKELDGDSRTREALLVRVNTYDRLEYLPVGLCLDGSVRRGAWTDPFLTGHRELPGEFLLVGWFERAGSIDVYTMQGMLGYVELTFDLPACGGAQ